MADTSRKRSRKSKLVPRECAVGEDDLELQVSAPKVPKAVKQPTNRESISTATICPPEPTFSKQEEVDTSVLRKINAATKEDKEPKTKTSPRKFEINIEVESCDDDNEFEELAEPNANETTRIEPIELSRDIILDAADNILKDSPNIADKILNIYIRNTIGFELKSDLVLDCHEKGIQNALDQWRYWQSRSFHREDPLFYKCYICTRSWWHLEDFRQHLSTRHPGDLRITIAFEKYELHEANLIAYHERLVVIKDIYTEGLCRRCGKNYSAHELGLRFQEKYYRAEGCTKQFFSCMGLRDHVSSCSVCNTKDKRFQCDICRSRFSTEHELNGHLVLSHSVRTDIPIMSHYTKCKLCSERYICHYLHKCGQKGPHSECPHCQQSFPNVMALDMHVFSASKPYKCEICQEVMEYSCKKCDHMLEHTDKFMVVRRCLMCDGLNIFLNNEDAAAHRFLKHEMEGRTRVKRKYFFPKMLVPSSCVYKRLAELEWNQQESALEEEESVLEEEESVLEAKKSMPKDEESVPEEETALNSGKESILVREQKLQAELDLATKFMLGSVFVKQEPEDSEDSSGLVIKEEPFDEFESQTHEDENPTESDGHEITVKEEYVEEEEEEYEEDIIKLNFDIEDFLVKEETIQEDDDFAIKQTQTRESENDSEEISQQLKEDSMLEPEVIIHGDCKKKQKLYRCTKCGFTAKHRNYKNHVDSDCGTSQMRHKTYKCTKCQNTYGSMKKYLTHFTDHGYRPLSCPDCLKESSTYTLLGTHLQQHIKQNFVRVKMITHAGKTTTKPKFQCKRCGKITEPLHFFEHWELHVNAQPTHPIKVTSRPIYKHGELHETILRECIALLYKQPKECNHCHRKFNRVNECKRHIIEHLLHDAYNHKHIYNEFRCQICEQGFPIPEKYKQHMRDHASLPVYKCELCDRTFSDSSNFTKHKKVHNLKVIICDLCGKKFQSKMSLEKHLEKHVASEKITCKICNKIFYFETAYRRHVRYFHEKTVIGFRCVICGERFDSLKLKWDHLWDVHKERKQKADCPICHMPFRNYSKVRRHARIYHMTDVSVVNIKKHSAKAHIDLNKYLRDPGKIKPQIMETLYVYDSD